MTVDAKASFPAAVAETSDSNSFILDALALYRSRNPKTTLRCVRDGVSCSQRFEQAFNEARAQGQNELAAAIQAVDYAATTCQEINDVSKKDAIFKGLIFGTAAAIVLGTSFGSCSGYDECPLCPTVPDCT